MTKREQELSEQLFGGRERSMGALEAIGEGLKAVRDAVVPGLTWDKITGDIGKELTHQVGAGAHELASLLFTGQAYVQYQREGKEDKPVHEQAHENQTLQQDSPHLHEERGGRSI